MPREKLRDDLGLEAGIVTLTQGRMASPIATYIEGIYATRQRFAFITRRRHVMSVLGSPSRGGCGLPGDSPGQRGRRPEVEKIGVVRSAARRSSTTFFHTPLADTQAATTKLLSLSRLILALEARRRTGQKIAFTNGCFDILHLGHVQYLNEGEHRPTVWWSG